jgi:hypothetical protein
MTQHARSIDRSGKGLRYDLQFQQFGEHHRLVTLFAAAA